MISGYGWSSNDKLFFSASMLNQVIFTVLSAIPEAIMSPDSDSVVQLTCL